MIDGDSNDWGGWASNEEAQLARWAALTPAERLEWLEEAKAFLALVQEVRAKEANAGGNGDGLIPGDRRAP